MGRIAKIWVKRFKGGPMDEVRSVAMTPETGIEGNAQSGRKRQVTLLAIERWRDAERELGRPADPALRRANILLEGVDLVESRGRTIRLGEVELYVWGETRPCRKMDEASAGLQAALDPEWRAGAHAEVAIGGTVRVGDEVSLGAGATSGDEAGVGAWVGARVGAGVEARVVERATE